MQCSESGFRSLWQLVALNALLWCQPSGLRERKERKITCRAIITKSMWWRKNIEPRGVG